MTKKGFTLVEILVALGLFTMTTSVIAGIFIMASGAQRRTVITQRVQNNNRAIMEAIATDMRIGIPNYTAYGGTAPILGTEILRLLDEDNNPIVYQRSTIGCPCLESSPCLTRQMAGFTGSITSKGVRVQNVRFYIFPSTNPFPGGINQPRVTILLTLESIEPPPNRVRIGLQTTVSSRVYGP